MQKTMAGDGSSGREVEVAGGDEVQRRVVCGGKSASFSPRLGRAG